MDLYVAKYYDRNDKMWHVAGVYSCRTLAEKRLEELDSGGVQTVTLDEPVRFIFELSPQSGKESK